MYNIHMLPGSFGDCLLLEYGENNDPKYILVDGGPYYQFDEIVTTLQQHLPDMKEIELLIITHIDIDHIDGIIRLLNHQPPLYKIKKVWFNNYEDLHFEENPDLLGGVQGEYLSLLVKDNEIPKNRKPLTIHRTAEELAFSDEMVITVLNPNQAGLKNLAKAWDEHLEDTNLSHEEKKIWEALNGDDRYEALPPDLLGSTDDVEAWAGTVSKEDKSAANRSSIAFIATYNGKSVLMAGDATSEDLKQNIEKKDLLSEFGQMQVDAWKLSHHGSKKSTQEYLTRMIQADKILVCSDGKRYHHPDKETIAKLLINQESKLDIYFNYTSSYNKIWGDQEIQRQFDARFHYPLEEGYMKISLEE